MSRLTGGELTILFASLGVLLTVARVLSTRGRRLFQISVVAEICAGILLGPTVLGHLAPSAHAALFPREGHVATFFHGFTQVSVVLFLLVAGMEVDLSRVWRQGRRSLLVTVSGIVFPFGVGWVAATLVPELLARDDQADPLTFTLFFATALSISALPVIAKTLIDLKLYRTDFGVMIMTAAIIEDLVGWTIFALILGRIGAEQHANLPVGGRVLATVAFVAFTLTVVRWGAHRAIQRLQSSNGSAGPVLAFALSMALFGAALTEWIGVHALFGSFLVGIAIGDSPALRVHTRTVLEQFISFIFAPLFFASIGLRVDFVAHFDLVTVLVVLVIACVGKVVGCAAGARLSGQTSPREAWAVGFAMNARGAMEIILAMLALEAGIISERLFVALVIMAVVTSLISGPAIRRLLSRAAALRFSDYLAPSPVVALPAGDRERAIEALVRALPAADQLDLSAIKAAVLAREAQMQTALGRGIAAPQALVEGLTRPAVVVGASAEGVDFDAHDGLPAKLVFLVLAPIADAELARDIVADIARCVSGDGVVLDELLVARSTRELLAKLPPVPRAA